MTLPNPERAVLWATRATFATVATVAASHLAVGPLAATLTFAALAEAAVAAAHSHDARRVDALVPDTPEELL